MPRLICYVYGFAAPGTRWAHPYIIGEDPSAANLPHSCLIGRDPDTVNVLVCGDPRVSREHFLLTIDTNGCFSFTNRSRNGVWLHSTQYVGDISVFFDPTKDSLGFGVCFELSFRRLSADIWSAAISSLTTQKAEKPKVSGNGLKDERLAKQMANLAQVRQEVAQKGAAGILSAAPGGLHPTFPTRMPGGEED